MMVQAQDLATGETVEMEWPAEFEDTPVKAPTAPVARSWDAVAMVGLIGLMLVGLVAFCMVAEGVYSYLKYGS